MFYSLYVASDNSPFANCRSPEQYIIYRFGHSNRTHFSPRVVLIWLIHPQWRTTNGKLYALSWNLLFLSQRALLIQSISIVPGDWHKYSRVLKQDVLVSATIRKCRTIKIKRWSQLFAKLSAQWWVLFFACVATSRIMNTRCPLTQIETLTMNGVDISNPEKLSPGQWTMVCAQAQLPIPDDMTSMVRPCSKKLADLLDASGSKCQKDDLSNPTKTGKVNVLHDVQSMQTKQMDAMCQAVDVLVRLRVAMRTNMSSQIAKPFWFARPTLK